MKQTKAELRAKERYNKENTKTYCLRLNKKTDAELIDFLDTYPGSRNGLIKAAVKDYKNK